MHTQTDFFFLFFFLTWICLFFFSLFYFFFILIHTCVNVFKPFCCMNTWTVKKKIDLRMKNNRFANKWQRVYFAVIINSNAFELCLPSFWHLIYSFAQFILIVIIIGILKISKNIAFPFTSSPPVNWNVCVVSNSIICPKRTRMFQIYGYIDIFEQCTLHKWLNIECLIKNDRCIYSFECNRILSKQIRLYSMMRKAIKIYILRSTIKTKWSCWKMDFCAITKTNCWNWCQF